MIQMYVTTSISQIINGFWSGFFSLNFMILKDFEIGLVSIN